MYESLVMTLIYCEMLCTSLCDDTYVVPDAVYESLVMTLM